jgi:hypothetical protein
VSSSTDCRATLEMLPPSTALMDQAYQALPCDPLGQLKEVLPPLTRPADEHAIVVGGKPQERTLLADPLRPAKLIPWPSISTMTT